MSPYTNLEYLDEFTGGDPELMKMAIQRYLANSPKLLEKLNESYMKEDWEQVAFTAHSLYSSTQIVGIISLEHPLKDIQKLAKDKTNSDQIHNYINQVNDAMNESYKELNNYNEKSQ